MKLFFPLYLLLIYFQAGHAQHVIDVVLSKIAINNKTIQAASSLGHAQNIEYQTGIFLQSPKIDYDFLIGSPANAGNQTDFAITQGFDFPTAYKKRKLLANEQVAQSIHQQDIIRQDILVTAKKICIEIIYRNKLSIELHKRKSNTEKWREDFQTKLNRGDGTILDVQKVSLLLIDIEASIQENESSIKILNEKLIELNGGLAIHFNESSYAIQDTVLNFEEIESQIEKIDPTRKFLEQEKNITQKKLDLTKSLVLPKMEAGYHHQAILGQRFNGLHLGVNVPIWENKNKIKSQEAIILLNEANLQSHVNEHYYEIKQIYEKQKNAKRVMIEYERLFNTSNHITLLDKSLSLGQITTLEYFLEVSWYHEAFKKYLLKEWEYQEALAELYKYKL